MDNFFFGFWQAATTTNHGRQYTEKRRIPTGLLDQLSYDPTSHKASWTIKTLTGRAQLVCDTPNSLRDENINTLNVFFRRTATTLTLLCFIKRFIYRPSEADETNRNPTPVTAVPIPYIKGTSETISRILKPYNYVTTLADKR